jgi:mRNA interferase MazF
MFSMNCSRNDAVLLPIPFTDLTSRKVRPAIVIGRSGADLFLVPISSVLSNTDFPLKEWRAAGLNVACGAKAQLATVEAGLVVKIVGKLSATDSGSLDGRLRTWLQL